MRFLGVIFAAGLTTLAACAPEVKTEAVQTEMAPMKLRLPIVGDKKVWKVGDGQLETIVTSFEGGMATTETSKGCSYTQEVGFAPSQKWSNCEPFTDGTQSNARTGNIFPLTVGSTESYAVKGRNADGNDWAVTRQCSVKGTARVNVPAGTFDTYHVVCADEFTKRDYYISPELGTSVLFRRTRKNNSGNTLQELISFTPGG